MHVLVVPRNLAIGGSQINAVDLAIKQAELGHNVSIGSTPAALVTPLRDSGVEFHELPPTSARLRRVRALRALIRAVQPDVIHAYEPQNILHCLLAAPMTPILGSIMSTRVPWYLPESLDLTVAMPALAQFTRQWRTGSTLLLPPPLRPPTGATWEKGELSKQLGLETDRVVVVVSRLVQPFKAEGIIRTIRAVTSLTERSVGLIVVGEGPSRLAFEGEAERVMAQSSRRTIAFAGEMADPSVAYAEADVVVGNGTAVIGGMVRGVPAVVIGREGFSVRATPDNFDRLAVDGFYGVGTGVIDPDPLREQIMNAIESTRPENLAAITALIEANYGLDALSNRLEQALTNAAASSTPRWRLLEERVRAPFRFAHYRIRRDRLRNQATKLGLVNEEQDNYVFGRLRNLALPPSAIGTGRNRRQLPPSDSKTDSSNGTTSGATP